MMSALDIRKRHPFYKWLNELPYRAYLLDSVRPNPMGFLLNWLKGGRRNRMPDPSVKTYDDWVDWINQKAAKAQAPALIVCLGEAWAEWERGKPGALDGPEEKVQVRSAVSTFRRQVKSMYENGAVENSETLMVHEFKGPVAYANVKMGLTHDLGGYESIRIDIGIGLPCYLEELGDAMEAAKAFVDNQVEEEMKKYRKTFRVLRGSESVRSIEPGLGEEQGVKEEKEPEQESKKEPVVQHEESAEENVQEGEETSYGDEKTDEADMQWETPEIETDEPLF